MPESDFFIRAYKKIEIFFYSIELKNKKKNFFLEKMVFLFSTAMFKSSIFKIKISSRNLIKFIKYNPQSKNVKFWHFFSSKFWHAQSLFASFNRKGDLNARTQKEKFSQQEHKPKREQPVDISFIYIVCGYTTIAPRVFKKIISTLFTGILKSHQKKKKKCV